MTGVADLHEAVLRVWNNSNLNTPFEDYWSNADKAEFTVLNDGEAQPAQPFPYCLFSQEGLDVVNRMSGPAADTKREVRRVPWLFTIYARSTATKTAKRVAADLVNEVLHVFGGHPTERADVAFELSHGNFLQSQYQSDVGARAGQEEYKWTIRYVFLIDVPVRT